MTLLYRVRTVFSGAPGTPYLSTLYLEKGATTAQSAANAVGGFWGAVDAVMATTITWSTEPEVVTIDDATGSPTAVDQTTPTTGTGASATQQLPRASQGLIRWRTGVFIGAKEIRGRCFLPGLTESGNAVDGQLEAATVATLNAAATAYIATVGVSPHVYSRAHATSAPISAGSAWNQFATLRSRRD